MTASSRNNGYTGKRSCGDRHQLRAELLITWERTSGQRLVPTAGVDGWGVRTLPRYAYLYRERQPRNPAYDSTNAVPTKTVQHSQVEAPSQEPPTSFLHKRPGSRRDGERRANRRSPSPSPETPGRRDDLRVARFLEFDIGKGGQNFQRGSLSCSLPWTGTYIINLVQSRRSTSYVVHVHSEQS